MCWTCHRKQSCRVVQSRPGHESIINLPCVLPVPQPLLLFQLTLLGAFLNLLSQRSTTKCPLDSSQNAFTLFITPTHQEHSYIFVASNQGTTRASIPTIKHFVLSKADRKLLLYISSKGPASRDTGLSVEIILSRAIQLSPNQPLNDG